MSEPVQVPVRDLNAKPQCPECRHSRPALRGGTYCTVGQRGDELYVIRGRCPQFQQEQS